MTAPTLTPAETATVSFDHIVSSLRHRATTGAVLAVPMDNDMLRDLTRGGLEALRSRAVVSWEHGASGTHLFGLGVAARFGANRGEALTPELVLGALRLETDGQIEAEALPRFFGGYHFDGDQKLHDVRWDPLGAWQLVLPEVLISMGPSGASGSICVYRGPNAAAHPTTLSKNEHAGPAGGLDTDAWQAAVATAVHEIRANQYAKTVLARQRHIALGRAWSRRATLSALADRYPGCFVFQFGAENAAWLGASPERLVSLSNGVARADSLAGSVRRGTTADADEALALQLLADPKERDEHAFVVRAISESLAPHTRLLEHPAEPVVMKLANIQHLHTPVTATVQPGTTVLDLVRAMHPTPAVGGWPRAKALDAIRRLEQMDRGWYASPIGWLDFEGNGEFAVGLRSALITRGEATLFAGAGIVEESDPEREVAEIGLKFKPLEEALRTGGA